MSGEECHPEAFDAVLPMVSRKLWEALKHYVAACAPPENPGEPVPSPSGSEESDEDNAARMATEHAIAFRARGGAIAMPPWNERGEADRAGWLHAYRFVRDTERSRVHIEIDHLRMTRRHIDETIVGWWELLAGIQKTTGESTHYAAEPGDELDRLHRFERLLQTWAGAHYGPPGVPNSGKTPSIELGAERWRAKEERSRSAAELAEARATVDAWRPVMAAVIAECARGDRTMEEAAALSDATEAAVDALAPERRP